MRAMLVCVVGVLVGLPACTQVMRYIKPAKEPEVTEEQQVETLAMNFRRMVAEKMVSARVLVNAYPYEGLFVMPAAEFARLKDILSRTEAVRPAKGDNMVVYVSYPSFQTLIMKDAEGHQYDLPMMDQIWMRKSEADALSPMRPRRSDEPRWCLPDEDYAALHTLPTVRQARAWGRLYSPGTSLVIPNGGEPGKSTNLLNQ